MCWVWQAIVLRRRWLLFCGIKFASDSFKLTLLVLTFKLLARFVSITLVTDVFLLGLMAMCMSVKLPTVTVCVVVITSELSMIDALT